MFKGFLVGAILGSVIMIITLSFSNTWPYYIVLTICSLIYYNLKEKK